MYTNLRPYWRRRRRGYQRLNESTNRRRRSFWRIKIKMASPKSLFVWLHDAYVRVMRGLANSPVIGAAAYCAGFPAAFGKEPLKEYDEKLVIEIYKSLVKAHGQSQLVASDTEKLGSMSSLAAILE